MIHYVFSSESLRAVNSLRIVNSLRVLFLVCRGLLGAFQMEVERGGVSQEGRRGGAHTDWEGVCGEG